MMKKHGMLMGACCLFILQGCEKLDTFPSKKDASSQPKQHVTTEQLNYQDQDRWELESGDAQSPINIDTSKIVPMQDAGDIQLDYNTTVQDEEDNGHTIQVDDTGTAQINGRTFAFTQFHFHAPSEHTINGKHYPVEVHFVHKSQDGRLAVIGVLFQEGKENKGFQDVLDHVKAGQKNTEVGILDITSMIPVHKSYYHYLGSLTTPPLSENVEWYVMKEVVEASPEQIKAFQTLYSGTNRKVQPLHQRVVLYHQDQDAAQK
ncbi:carbonic anhydrase family protein [Bacillus thuringiensis]|nr:carbonic anhydrase family protein [Bacillus thuringiensis]